MLSSAYRNCYLINSHSSKRASQRVALQEAFRVVNVQQAFKSMIGARYTSMSWAPEGGGVHYLTQRRELKGGTSRKASHLKQQRGHFSARGVFLVPWVDVCISTYCQGLTPLGSIAENKDGRDSNEFQCLGCAPSTRGIEVLCGAAATKFEDYLVTSTNKCRLTLER